MTDTLMQGFPPLPENQVSLANWRQAPFCSWGFCHVAEIIPSATIANDPSNIRHLEEAPEDVIGISIDGPEGRTVSVADVLNLTDTDGFIVLHGGQIACEQYRRHLTPDTRHIIFSVSKSVTAIVAGILEARGELDPDAPITSYVREMEGSAYDGATVRHLLDMRTGIEFLEDYLATEGAIVRYRESTGWNPAGPGCEPGLRQFLQTLKDKDQSESHGGRFRYLSPNTDMLGWVLERASGLKFSDLLSETLWRSMGAAHTADVTVDAFGAPRTAGGISLTLRDLARLGQLLLEGGAWKGEQVIPENWINDVRSNGDAEAWAKGDFADQMPAGMRYRSKWYVLGDNPSAFFGIGIHGQYVYVDPVHDVVIVKLSSNAEPLDEFKDRLTLSMFAGVAKSLSS